MSMHLAVSPIRMIIVDDRTPAREGLRALISVLGKPINKTGCPSLEVVGEACDGTQAIQLVEEQHPDVILMDVRMPGLSGIDATRLIKASWPDTHIILMSFYRIHCTEALTAGADSFLLKGFSPEDLLEAILKVRIVGSDVDLVIGKAASSMVKENPGG